MLEKDGPLIQQDGSPYKKRKFGQPGTQEEHPMKMKAEIGVMLPQAKEDQRLPANRQTLEKRPGIDPHSPWEGPTCQYLDLGHLASRTLRQ